MDFTFGKIFHVASPKPFIIWKHTRKNIGHFWFNDRYKISKSDWITWTQYLSKSFKEAKVKRQHKNKICMKMLSRLVRKWLDFIVGGTKLNFNVCFMPNGLLKFILLEIQSFPGTCLQPLVSIKIVFYCRVKTLISTDISAGREIKKIKKILQLLSQIAFKNLCSVRQLKKRSVLNIKEKKKKKSVGWHIKCYCNFIAVPCWAQFKTTFFLGTYKFKKFIFVDGGKNVIYIFIYI